MAMGYEPKGLLSLPSHRSKDVHEEMRFTTTLPKLYQRPTPVPIIPLLPVMPPPPPAPYFSSPLNQAHLTPSSASTSTSSGLMVLDGSPVVEVSSLSNAYVKRELSAELYSQVKSHVNEMVKHPYEKTLKYKVESALGSARGFVVYAKWKILRRLRVVLARVCLR